MLPTGLVPLEPVGLEVLPGELALPGAGARVAVNGSCTMPPNRPIGVTRDPEAATRIA
jgi:hypothetical protein